VLTFAQELGFQLRGLTYSPITGGEGNIEFLAYWYKPEEGSLPIENAHLDKLDTLCEGVVKEASKTFRE
jgi:23S rRNA (cytidine1920-2'-O)/16S rRNA (cytidine1409-2'-O)-methyltransferase